MPLAVVFREDEHTMADRMFERAFSRAAAASVNEDAERPMQAQRESVQAEAGAAAKVPAAPA